MNEPRNFIRFTNTTIRAAVAKTCADLRLSPTPTQTEKAVTALGADATAIDGSAGMDRLGQMKMIVGSWMRMCAGRDPHDTREGLLLLASTGRAARNLQGVLADAFGMEASTVHAALGYDAKTGHWAHNSWNPLPHGLVIIDEVEMCDAESIAALEDALPNARFVVAVDLARAVENNVPEMPQRAGNPLTSLLHMHRRTRTLDEPRTFHEIVKGFGLTRNAAGQAVMSEGLVQELHAPYDDRGLYCGCRAPNSMQFCVADCGRPARPLPNTMKD